MTRLPPEARAALMRAWLEILKERHPEVTWIAKDEPSIEDAGSADHERAELALA